MIKKITNSKFKKDILFSYITQALVILFGFINIYLITNYASVEAFGQYSILVATVGFMSLLLTARSGEAIVRFYKREKQNHNYQNAKAYLFYGFVIDIITATLLFMLAFLLSNFISASFLKDTALSDTVTTFALVNVFFFLRGTMVGYLQANEMFYFFNGIKIIDATLLTIILFYSLTNIGNELIDIVNSYVYTNIILFILVLLTFIFFSRKEFRGIKAQLKKTSLIEYLKYNMITFSSSALKAGNQNFDNLVLSYFTNPTIVGIYSIVKKFFIPVQVMITPFQSISYPKLTKLWYEKQYVKFDSTIKRIVKLLLTGTLIYFVLLFLFSDFLINTFNINYDNPHFLIILMMGLFLFTPLLWWTRNFSNIINPKYSLYAGIYYTFCQVLLFPPIVALFGLGGLVTTMIILTCGLFFYWIIRYKKAIIDV